MSAEVEQSQVPVAGATKPSGTRALLYAVLSLAVAVVGWLVAFVLAEVTGASGGLAFGVVFAAASVPVALVVALIQRLSSDRKEVIRLRRVAALAVGVPVAFAVALTVLDIVWRMLA